MQRTFVSIGELAERAGVATSALRYYEEEGLIESVRTPGNQRQYPKDTLRRIAFVRAAQTVGLTLDEIRRVLQTLPDRRTPNKDDWERVAKSWRPLLEERIAALERIRDKLTSCIGCGCLSLPACALYNTEDIAARRGAGARYLLGDKPVTAKASKKRRLPRVDD